MVQPFIPFANCAEILIEGTLASQAADLTLACRKGSPFAGTDLQDIADLVAGWVVNTLLDFISDDYSANSVKVTDLTTQFSPVAFSTAGLPANGAVTGIPVPNNVAAVVSFATNNRGRSFRGRNYIPGAPSAELQTTSEFQSTYAASLAGAYQDLADGLGVAGFDHVILSRQENGVRRTTGVATRVTEYLGRTPVGTQRRRVIGHGA